MRRKRRLMSARRGGSGGWLLLGLLILAGLGWYLWDRGHIERWHAALFDPPSPTGPPVMLPEAQLTPSEKEELERLLDALALSPGPVDGMIDEETAGAIRAFQEMAGLPADGEATEALLLELREVAEQLDLDGQTEP